MTIQIETSLGTVSFASQAAAEANLAQALNHCDYVAAMGSKAAKAGGRKLHKQAMAIIAGMNAAGGLALSTDELMAELAA